MLPHTEKMMAGNRALLFLLCSFLCCAGMRSDSAGDIVTCLKNAHVANVTGVGSPSFTTLLDYSIQNLRFAQENVSKPYVIIIPESNQDVQAAVKCAVTTGWQITVRSGGHSYEGLSSTSDVPFVIVDLMRLDRVSVDLPSKTAWVGAGATLGQIYTGIAAKTDSYGFPAGVCPTIGAGGHFSGGGFSLLSRKYGLAADNVVDAIIVDAAGNIHDNRSMGSDVFWAVRGGGGGSFGIVVAWKVRLVPVPKVLTAFNARRTGGDQVTQLVHLWQTVAPAAEPELFVRAVVSRTGDNDVQVTFNGMFLGRANELLQKLQNVFPELELAAAECEETSWIGSVAYTASTNVSQLSERYYTGKGFFKAKSDFVQDPLSEDALRGAWKFLEEQSGSYVILAPLGGFTDEIPSDAIAFPFRKGYKYFIQYQVTWSEAEETTEAQYVGWIRRFYDYMGAYVSKRPRGAYVNYIDLDLGAARNGTTSVERARSLWGEKYFAGNFERLVSVKTRFDPSNVFRHAQSIPVAR